MSHVTEIQELFLYTWADMCTPASKDPIKSDYVGFFFFLGIYLDRSRLHEMMAACVAMAAAVTLPRLSLVPSVVRVILHFKPFWQNYTQESLKDEMMPRFEAGKKGSEAQTWAANRDEGLWRAAHPPYLMFLTGTDHQSTAVPPDRRTSAVLHH